jgi:hypothetical protein
MPLLGTRGVASARGFGLFGPIPGDPFFSSTTLLLPGNGTNGAQNNTFLDSSTNNFTITRNGNTTQGTFSPFPPASGIAYSAAANGGSGSFDGSGDFLTLATNAALDMGTGNFTVEMWVYSTDASVDTQNRRFFATDVNGTASIQIGHVTTTTGVAQYCDNGTLGTVITGTTNILNQWAHIAVVRSSGTVTLYVNGVSEGTPATDAGNKGSASFTIGKYPGASGHIKGFMGSLRVVKGTAVYTANFTPPTAPLTAISGTSLLLNFTNAGVLDATAKNNLETVGNAQISTAQSKFGGSSIAFDGTGDWLLVPAGQNWEFGSGDFTVEMWLNPSSTTTTDAVISKGNASSTGNEVWTLQWGSANKLEFYSGGGLASPIVTSTTAFSTGAWYHVAVTRASGTTRIFVGGALEASSVTSYTVSVGGALYVAAGWFAPSSRDTSGYIDDLRITKGVARYTANFTAPTAAFPLY